MIPGVVVYLSSGEGLLRARSNWRHAVAVTLPIIGEANKIKYNKSMNSRDFPTPQKRVCSAYSFEMSYKRNYLL